MNKQQKGWDVKKEERETEEREQAMKELEHWEFKLRRARTEKQRALAEARVEYWKTLI